MLLPESLPMTAHALPLRPWAQPSPMTHPMPLFTPNDAQRLAIVALELLHRRGCHVPPHTVRNCTERVACARPS